MRTPLLWLLSPLLFIQCAPPEPEPRFRFEDRQREVPAFSADSAWHYINEQVEFGTRHPNSEGHRQTKDWLAGKLQEYAGPGAVYVQSFTEEGYEGEELELHNIVAAFNPSNGDRILLAAHWDTRPRAEEDPEYPDEPLTGADDGGSGTGVLIELARLFSENPPPVGVDIVLFDGEDYGRPGELDFYFLGARYWSNNLPASGYNPRFGILLDMTGGVDAVFAKEENSVRFAPSLVNALWELADELGYGEMFPDERGALVSDDHVIVQRHAGIPMINIIHHSRAPDGGAQFPPWWHTHRDNMEIIDRTTLQAVGDLLTEFIYNRIR
ncbi:MAG: M28 family peptidase [Balneolaceae bacterium]